MKLLLASDIFGDSPELRSTAQAMCDNFVVISPHSGAPVQFSDEGQAYAAFLACGGINSYAEKLALAFNKHKPDALVGFSVGATACWITLANLAHSQVQSATLFYGSRIKDHLQQRPACPTSLIFAEHEKSFDPQKLVATLRTAGMEASIYTGCQHGFMNELSPGYNPLAQKMGIEAVKSAWNLRKGLV